MNKERTLIFDYGATLDTNGIHWYHIFKDEHLKYNSFLDDEQLRCAYIYAEQNIARCRTIDSMHNFKDTLLIKVGLQYDYLMDNQIIKKDMCHTEQIVEACYLLAKQNTQRVKPMLEELKQEFNLGLVSNFYGNLDEVLKDFQIKECFDNIIESALVGYSKPDKRLWLFALDKLNTKVENTIVVGDSYKKDIIPTKQLGCSTIWLKGKGWKDNPTNVPFADMIITDILQVKKILK